MSLENTFYLVGIICMTLYTLLLVVIVGIMIYIKRKVTEVHDQIERKFENIKDIIDHPSRTAAIVGAAAVDKVIDKAVEFVQSRKKKS